MFAAGLRADGLTWVEVASAFRDRYGANARAAFRLVHGWSQQEVADRWNERWPTSQVFQEHLGMGTVASGDRSCSLAGGVGPTGRVVRVPDG
jgi:hypothetical protein